MSGPSIYDAFRVHLQRVRLLAATRQFEWKALASPNPDALRAFQGETGSYLVNVVQANVYFGGDKSQAKVVHEAVIVSKLEGYVIRVDRELADTLWHQAAAASN